MRIVIDLQACQTTGSRFRGIGRYSFALTNAILKNAGSHDVHIMLNGMFPETIAPIRQSFSELLPSDHIHIWKAPEPVFELNPNNLWRCRSAEFIREQAIANLRPDIVHVTSLFEGSGDNAVTSIGLNGEYVPNAVTLYDLIPYIHIDHYLKDERQRSWYFKKLASLRRADISLAISESSKREGIEYLGLSPSKVINISSAVDAHFVQSNGGDSASLVLEKFGITKSFVMYTGGVDLRKNVDSLVRAFSQLGSSLKRQFQLAIVCHVQEVDRDRLLRLAMQQGIHPGDLILTGYVTDQELVSLYQKCAAFVFPSWHEGFGLPALEAMSCGAPVIAANTSSLPEVVGRSDALFDPYQEHSIVSKLSEVLTNKAFRESLIAHGLVQSKKFSWDQSAKKTIEAFERIHEEKKCGSLKISHYGIRPRLAYFSPLPKLETGVAVFSAKLLPVLSNYYDIDLIVDQEIVDEKWLHHNFKIRDVTWFKQHAEEFDRIIYNIGNSPFHAYMLEMLNQFSGVVILHDFYLGGLYSFVQQIKFNKNIFIENLYHSHGYPALLDKKYMNQIAQIIWDFPSNLPVLNSASGVIVHSEFSIKLAQDWYGAKLARTFEKIPHFHEIPVKINKSKARVALGIQDDEFLVCSFGFLGETKLNKRLFEAWSNSPLLMDKRAKLIFVGQTDGSEYCKSLILEIEEKSVDGNIQITGYIENDLYINYLQAADVAVQMRGNSRGEASYTVLDCLAYGLPTIVNSHGAMKELSAQTLIKLPDLFSQKELITAILELRNNAPLINQLTANGTSYIQQYCDLESIANKYFESIEKFYLTESKFRLKRTIKKISNIETADHVTPHEIMRASHYLAMNQTIGFQNQILLDISEFDSLDEINNVRKFKELLSAFLRYLFQKISKNVRVEPVVIRYVKNQPVLYYARKLTCSLLDISNTGLVDEVVEYQLGNLIIALKTSNIEHIQIERHQNFSDLELFRKRKIDFSKYWNGQDNFETTVQKLFEVFCNEVSMDGGFPQLKNAELFTRFV